jgi:hypothetical protein
MLITTYTLHILIHKMDQQGTQKALTHVGHQASIKIAEMQSRSYTERRISRYIPTQACACT